MVTVNANCSRNTCITISTSRTWANLNTSWVLKFSRSPKGLLFLNKRKYVLDILKEVGLMNAKPSSTPMEQRHRLSEEAGKPLTDPLQYRRLVGRLLYLTITRPYITYVVHILSQFMQSPKQDHWIHAIKVLQYLKSNPAKEFYCRPVTPCN